MRQEGIINRIRLLKTRNGFTLIEAILSVALLAVVVIGASAPYLSGLQALNVQTDYLMLDSRLRSRMEILLSTEFSSLDNGSESINIGGETYTLSWTAIVVDLDGDLIPEPNAMQITTTINDLPDCSLTAIVVDNSGKIGKIS